MNRKSPIQMSDDIVESLGLFALWLEKGVHPEGFEVHQWISNYGPRMLVLEAVKTIEGLRSFAKLQGYMATQFEDELHKANVKIRFYEEALCQQGAIKASMNEPTVAAKLQHSPETLLDSEGHQQGECDAQDATCDGQSAEPGNPPGRSG